ncbi:MAG TPA: class I SAM-dependent methyltransferase [Chthoniobacteraceae bacterium]|nr:class I SAM-dependent methyltransferase [Chthoniobacteraceae bacterium]
MSAEIEGQLSAQERQLLTDTILGMAEKPRIVVEVGTWLGGGSTAHILRALHKNGEGRLWGVEAVKATYDKMLANISAAVPEAADRFTPLFGLSSEVLPAWVKTLPAGSKIDVAFLDGGDNPNEQVEEFKLLAPLTRVGGVIMGHDANMRKGKWFVPYVSLLDNWESKVFDYSREGLFFARKTREAPSVESLNAAEKELRRLKMQPIDLIARMLPSSFKGAFLRAVPKPIFQRLFKGRK